MPKAMLGLLIVLTASAHATVGTIYGGRSSNLRGMLLTASAHAATGTIHGDPQSEPLLRLRGGMFECGSTGKMQVPLRAERGGSEEEDPKTFYTRRAAIMRMASYSVLDTDKVVEPGLGASGDAEIESGGDDPPSRPIIAEPATENESAEFAKQAKVQANVQKASNIDSCRVKAALEAQDDDNLEKYEDFNRENIVVVASEHASYAKTGGLADVVDKLSLALALRGHRVMTVIPMYGEYEGVMPTGIKRSFGLFGSGHEVQYFHKWLPLGLDRWGNETGVDHVRIYVWAAVCCSV